MGASKRRDGQRGNAIVLALIVLSGLGTLSMLTVFEIRGGLQTTASDRARAIALYAAESGGAAGIEFLRSNLQPTAKWNAYVSPANSTPVVPAVLGNQAAPGDPNSVFSSGFNASYKVEILNNRSDTGFAAGTDDDGQVIVRSTGYGPEGAIAIIEWELMGESAIVARPCSVYAQRSQSEENSGRNDCLGTIDTSQTESFTP
ncbi:MAG: hypothetical protein SFX73_29890 [Kofleriaceae bacterium]|nr:hypothetical protein [Kofleriaceae bacterium]